MSISLREIESAEQAVRAAAAEAYEALLRAHAACDASEIADCRIRHAGLEQAHAHLVARLIRERCAQVIAAVRHGCG